MQPHRRLYHKHLKLKIGKQKCSKNAAKQIQTLTDKSRTDQTNRQQDKYAHHNDREQEKHADQFDSEQHVLTDLVNHHFFGLTLKINPSKVTDPYCPFCKNILYDTFHL